MNGKFTVICSVTGAVWSIIAGALGGWDIAVGSLIFFMAVDFIMGLVCAVIFGKSNKSQNGGLSSSACWKGIAKKVGTLIMVMVSHRLDMLIGTDYVRNAVIYAFCVAEIVSICETAVLMEVLPPDIQNIFIKALDILKGKNDKK